MLSESLLECQTILGLLLFDRLLGGLIGERVLGIELAERLDGRGRGESRIRGRVLMNHRCIETSFIEIGASTSERVECPCFDIVNILSISTVREEGDEVDEENEDPGWDR